MARWQQYREEDPGPLYVNASMALLLSGQTRAMERDIERARQITTKAIIEVDKVQKDYEDSTVPISVADEYVLRRLCTDLIRTAAATIDVLDQWSCGEPSSKLRREVRERTQPVL